MDFLAAQSEKRNRVAVKRTLLKDDASLTPLDSKHAEGAVTASGAYRDFHGFSGGCKGKSELASQLATSLFYRTPRNCLRSQTELHKGRLTKVVRALRQYYPSMLGQHRCRTVLSRVIAEAICADNSPYARSYFNRHLNASISIPNPICSCNLAKFAWGRDAGCYCHGAMANRQCLQERDNFAMVMSMLVDQHGEAGSSLGPWCEEGPKARLVTRTGNFLPGQPWEAWAGPSNCILLSPKKNIVGKPSHICLHIGGTFSPVRQEFRRKRTDSAEIDGLPVGVGELRHPGALRGRFSVDSAHWERLGGWLGCFLLGCLFVQ